MTVLFDNTIPIQAGPHESPVFNIPAQFQQPGQTITVRIDATPFPDGRTTINVFISTDDGATYKNGGMTVDRPPAPRFAGSFESCGFSLGADEIPTNAKYSTDAPLAFTARVIIEAA